MQSFRSSVSVSILSVILLLSGCTSTLVRDDVKRTAGVEGHCAGSEWVDDSSIAVLPVPVVAFVTPHVDVRNISSEPYVSRCGASTRVVNRDVSVSRLACIPAGLTRIITHGRLAMVPRAHHVVRGRSGRYVTAGRLVDQ